MQARHDRSGDVRNVGKHTRSHTLGNLTDAFEVDNSRISRSAAHEQLRLMFLGEPLQLVIVYGFGLARDAVIKNLVAQT